MEMKEEAVGEDPALSNEHQSDEMAADEQIGYSHLRFLTALPVFLYWNEIMQAHFRKANERRKAKER